MSKKDDVLTALHGTQTASTQEVADKAGTSHNTAHNTLKRLESAGEVGRTADNRWHVARRD